jgi:competence protein ComEC
MKLYPEIPLDHISHFMDIKKTVIQGKIDSFARHYDKKTKVTLECLNITAPDDIKRKVKGRIDLSIYLSSGELPQYGDVIEFESSLRSNQNFQNPGAFDYVRYSKHVGLSGTSYCDQKKLRILTDKDQVNIFTHFIRSIEKFRMEFCNFISDHTGHSDSGMILASLITGKTEYISPDLRELFSKSGISHLYAISGLHLTIIGLVFFTVIFYFLSFFPDYLITGKAKKAAWLITIIPLTLYCIFSGFAASIQRAFIMTVVLLFSLISEKEKDILSSLSISGILILLIDSAALFSISFQLSFSAVFFIIYGLSLIKKDSFPYKSHLLGRSALIVCVTFFAALGTSPLTAHYFNIVSFVQIASNLLLIPIIGTVALLMGVLALFCFSFLPVFSGVMIDLCCSLISFSIYSSEILVSIPFSWLRVMTLDWPEVTLIYLISACIYTALKGQKKSSLAMGVLIVCFSVYIFLNTIPNKNPDNLLNITVIDVGQGNSTLIQAPQGHTILVDGGGFSETSAFDTGKNILAPFLWQNKTNTIDYVILSHPEADHLNGLIYILKNFNVKTLIKNRDVIKTEAYEDMIEVCAKKGIRIWEPAYKGETMSVGEMGVIFFEGLDNASSNKYNNNSLVFKISYKDVSMLFPGDILSEREKILSMAKDLNLHSDILLAPHHGSSSSSTQLFIDTVLPGNVIISCGRDNRYKFPHADVLKRYSNLGARIYRTDKDGAVFISSDGRDYSIRTHKGG